MQAKTNQKENLLQSTACGNK